MKTTKTFVLILMGVISMPAWGLSMCIPPAASGAYTTTDATAANNRGRFAIGGTCTANNTDRTITCTKTPNALGESHCSVSGTYPASDWESGGGYCWCRLTDVVSGNGYMAPRSGGWVLSYPYSVSNCTSYCARSCTINAGDYRGFRRALFAAPGS